MFDPMSGRHGPSLADTELAITPKDGQGCELLTAEWHECLRRVPHGAGLSGSGASGQQSADVGWEGAAGPSTQSPLMSSEFPVNAAAHTKHLVGVRLCR